VEVVEAFDEKQAGDLLGYFEGIGNATGPENIPDGCDLAAIWLRMALGSTGFRLMPPQSGTGNPGIARIDRSDSEPGVSAESTVPHPKPSSRPTNASAIAAFDARARVSCLPSR
jgi:hypothetical protein